CLVSSVTVFAEPATQLTPEEVERFRNQLRWIASGNPLIARALENYIGPPESWPAGLRAEAAAKAPAQIGPQGGGALPQPPQPGPAIILPVGPVNSAILAAARLPMPLTPPPSDVLNDELNRYLNAIPPSMFPAVAAGLQPPSNLQPGNPGSGSVPPPFGGNPN